MFTGPLHRSQLRCRESRANRQQTIGRTCFETLEGRRLLSFSTPAVNYSTVGTPSFIVTADFNNDGKLDLATCANAVTGSISVLLGNGAGSFGAVQRTVIGTQLSSMAVADFDSDGNVDIVVADTGYSALHLLKGNGDGTFQPTVTREQWGYLSEAAAGDFNNDGKADLLVRVWEWDNFNDMFQVRLGDGTGGFGDSYYLPRTWDTNAPYMGIGLATVDLNRDGKLDMVTADVDAHLGNGNGTLQPGTHSPALGQAVATGDFTGDGNADVISVGTNSVLAVLRGKGDGTFHPAIPHTANGISHTAVAAADFNADGKLDAIATDGDLGTVSMMLGNGDGTLRYFGAYTTGTSPSGIVVGDFNRDGRPDVAVSNAGWDSRNVSILLNDGDWQTTPPPPPPPPDLSISDVTVTEGNTGTRNANFTLTLSKPAAVEAEVHFNAADISAAAGSDFDYTGGFVIFAAGETSKTLTVAVKGDRLPEPTETFAVNLLLPTNLRIADAQGIGTIIDDDLTFNISNVSRAEGNSGTTPFAFTVSLSSASDQPVQVNYTTASGSATSSGGNRDYQSTSGTLVFAPGQLSQTVTVSVVGDTRVESDETFYVNLSQPVGVTIADGQGIGTILTDDSGRDKKWAGPASGGNWSTASNWSPSGVPTADSLVTIAGAAAVTLSASATVSELSLNAGASLTVAQSGNRVFRTAGLFLDDASATLDLRDNDMILDYAPGNSSPLGGVSGLIAHGYNYSAWDGSGVVTRTTDAANGLTTLAPVEAAELLGLTGSQTALWDGQSVDATSVLIKYTYAGDANLDGVIDAADYGVIDNWIQFPGTTGYFNGDFNYDGVIDAGDYGYIDNNIQVQGPPL